MARQIITDEREALESFKNSSDFLWGNFEQLQEDHANQHVAVFNGKLVTASDSFFEVVRVVEERGLPLNNVLIWFIPPKGEVVVY